MPERRTTPAPRCDHHSIAARARSSPTRGVASAPTPARSGTQATTRSVLGAREVFATERRSRPKATRTAPSAYHSFGVANRSPIQTRPDGATMPTAPTAAMHRPITKARVFTPGYSGLSPGTLPPKPTDPPTSGWAAHASGRQVVSHSEKRLSHSARVRSLLVTLPATTPEPWATLHAAMQQPTSSARAGEPKARVNAPKVRAIQRRCMSTSREKLSGGSTPSTPRMFRMSSRGATSAPFYSGPAQPQSGGGKFGSGETDEKLHTCSGGHRPPVTHADPVPLEHDT